MRNNTVKLQPRERLCISLRQKWVVVTLLFLFLTPFFLGDQVVEAKPFGKTTLRYGARGGDVYELQGRLKYLGYYDGKIDGSFGSKTKNAVTWFQWKFGLKSDGLVGGKTKLKLWQATKAWKPSGGATSKPVQSSSGFSSQDLKLLAQAVYGEARGEPYTGQVAVAAVILNRLDDPNFPKTVSGILFEPLAFTAVADGQIWLTPNETAKKAVQDAINGWDPSSGATYYFNPATATSKWIWSRPQIKRIGKHIFCK
ncbi:spore cortex-lytic enzyme [Shimazuella sp. KC615]|uniref:Spore cortex-lytic enzyme n=1 Tax=Shimazuella alba TaxID=2690964 RepID=A0A6I4VXK3_9BACL|nr:spore cortex-lytic enzyme [Shimazuella alba]